MTESVRSQLDLTVRLTLRKIEIVRHLAAGKSVREIARALGVSIETVYEHLEHTRRRLAAHSNAELVCIALRHGFISDDRAFRA